MAERGIQKGVEVMPSFDIEVEFEVFCSCGNGLCNQSVAKSDSRRRLSVTVEPCEKCKRKNYDDGYEDGYDKGLEDA